MSVSLFELGYEVVGLDLSLEQLSVAKKRCKGPVYIHADMGNLPKDKFDILINVYTSFGYCSTEHEDLAVLPEWYEALNPGGILIM
ncbi:class I SAM-dependent methyltransferase, partial [Pantoea ananatis]